MSKTQLYWDLKKQFRKEGPNDMDPKELYYLWKNSTNNDDIFAEALAKRLVGSTKLNEIKWLYEYDPEMMTYNQAKTIQNTLPQEEQDSLMDLIALLKEKEDEITKMQRLFSEHLGQMVKIIFKDGIGNEHIKHYKIDLELIQNMQNYMQYDELKGVSVSDGKGSPMFIYGEPFFYNKNERRETRRSGGFFPYQPTKFMNKKIFNIIKEHIQDSPHPCLFDAISQNLIDLQLESKIGAFKSTLSCQFTKIESIKKLVTHEFGFSVRDYNNKKVAITYFENEQDYVLQIGYFKQHYFYDRNFTKFEIEQLKECNITFTNKELKTVGNLLKKLFDMELFEEKTYTYKDIIDKLEQNKEELMDKENLDISDMQKLLQPKQKPKEDIFIVAADTETITKNDDQTNAKAHKCYIVCGVSEYGKFSCNQPKEFINYIHELQKKQNRVANVFFHNMSYDLGQFIMAGCNISNELSVGGNMISCLVDGIRFRDFCKLIPNTTLKQLPKVFGLKVMKEVFPYEFYTEKNLNQKYGLIEEAMLYLKSDEEKELFEKNCKQLNLYKEVKGKKYFNVFDYSKFYCFQDCEVLYQSLLTFSKQLEEHFNLNLVDFNSISSLSVEYFRQQGCYDHVYKVGGQIRQFLQQCVVGGRVMTRYNKKYNVKGKISDNDAVSLYSSAMKMSYFPEGRCEILQKHEIEFYNKKQNLMKIKSEKESENQDTLFVRVKLTNPKKKYGFSLVSKKSKSGIRIFDNYESGIYFMSHVYLQDVVNFQGYDYKILSGLVFRQRNYKIQEIIQNMFDWRKQVKQDMKKENDEDKKNGMNTLQNIIKLMMNSFYGKNIENIHPYQNKIIRNDLLEDFVQDHYSRIKQIDEFPEYSVIQISQDVMEFSYAHCGIMILDMSKRIMNNVMCLAEDIGCTIYYQDTDSMHILKDDIPRLEKAYAERNDGKKLIGESMGQFHSDFSTKLEGFHVLYSKQLIALGKKCYLDVLECENDKGERKTDYHIRLKGVTDHAIEFLVKKDYEGKYENLYQELYDGKTISFDLCDGKVQFEKDKLYQHKTMGSFIRQIKFE